MSEGRSLSWDLGIPSVPEYSKDDPLLFFELQRIYNALNNLAGTLDLYSGRAPSIELAKTASNIFAATRSQYLDVVMAKAMVDIPAGAATYTRYNATDKIFEAYLASASSASTACTSFCVTDGGVTAGSYCSVQYSGGLVPFIAGMTEGVTYYLSNTPGTISNAPGTYTQKLGYAIGPVYFYFIPNPL